MLAFLYIVLSVWIHTREATIHPLTETVALLILIRMLAKETQDSLIHYRNSTEIFNIKNNEYSAEILRLNGVSFFLRSILKLNLSKTHWFIILVWFRSRFSCSVVFISVGNLIFYK